VAGGAVALAFAFGIGGPGDQQAGNEEQREQKTKSAEHGLPPGLDG
jgi:hypothetical protein